MTATCIYLTAGLFVLAVAISFLHFITSLWANTSHFSAFWTLSTQEPRATVRCSEKDWEFMGTITSLKSNVTHQKNSPCCSLLVALSHALLRHTWLYAFRVVNVISYCYIYGIHSCRAKCPMHCWHGAQPVQPVNSLKSHTTQLKVRSFSVTRGKILQTWPPWPRPQITSLNCIFFQNILIFKSFKSIMLLKCFVAFVLLTLLRNKQNAFSSLPPKQEIYPKQAKRQASEPLL